MNSYLNYLGKRAGAMAFAAIACTASFESLADWPPTEQNLPPLVLEKHGWFIVGGQLVQPTIDSTTRCRNAIDSGVVNPPQCVADLAGREQLIGQAFVEYFIPHKKRFKGANANKTIPIVMMHDTRSSINWLTTPDGREGWAHFFVRRGFPVFLIDPPGAGRAGFPVDQHNRVRAGLEPPSSQQFLAHGDSSEWAAFWQGPAPQVPGDGITHGYQMPNDDVSFRHWLQYSSPPGGSPGGGPGGTAARDPVFIQVLEKMGPAIWIGWSAGGNSGARALAARPELVKALIGIEGGCPNTPAAVSALADNQIPYLWVQGPTNAAGCQGGTDAVVAAGGTATLINLPDLGILGNSHMMMWEKNSDEIAQVVLEWIEQYVEQGPGKGPKKK